MCVSSRFPGIIRYRYAAMSAEGNYSETKQLHGETADI